MKLFNSIKTQLERNRLKNILSQYYRQDLVKYIFEIKLINGETYKHKMSDYTNLSFEHYLKWNVKDKGFNLIENKYIPESSILEINLAGYQTKFDFRYIPQHSIKWYYTQKFIDEATEEYFNYKREYESLCK